MHRLSSIILLLGLAVGVFGQSPHGDDFKMNCAACHNSDGWEIPMDSWNFDEPISPKKAQSEEGLSAETEEEPFNHHDTNFPLMGQHASTECIECHTALVFTEASSDCISCHVDIHQTTVGADCVRCHSEENWLVDNITEIHQENGFPLLGAHAQISCTDCHITESWLQFNRLGNACVNCHLEDYMSTTQPSHVASGYSLECMDCHDLNAYDWGANILHDFFPLVKGHDIDCISCHVTGEFMAIPADCISCHQEDYDAALNPDHKVLDFSTDCAACHTLDLDWMPAEYRDHDAQFFPIYSGAHNGEWDQCVDCHTNPSDYSIFTCTTCHEKNETDDDHDGVGGYVYESNACLVCHPTGSEDDNFDHNQTNFPLTGAHIGVDCNQCHTNGYAGTPTECSACHTADFQQTTSPDHELLGFSMDCVSCHTTEPNWRPATFDHDQYWVLNGKHAEIANDCAACHNATFTNTPTTCFGCHESDYNNADDPNHLSANFPITCESCHNENGWEPADFDHDGMYFPIYSGPHQGEWNDCIECHTVPGNFAVFSCIDCHEHNDPAELLNDHEDVNGYSYDSISCFECHPKGEADD